MKKRSNTNLNSLVNPKRTPSVKQMNRMKKKSNTNLNSLTNPKRISSVKPTLMSNP
jgi:hypothetical protein